MTEPAIDVRPLPNHAKAKWQQIKQLIQAAQQPILAQWGAYIEATMQGEGVDAATSTVHVDEERDGGVYTVTPKTG